MFIISFSHKPKTIALKMMVFQPLFATLNMVYRGIISMLWVYNWYQHVVGLFCLPSCCKKKENTAFDLVLRIAWKLLGPSKQVARSSTHVGKGAKFGVQKMAKILLSPFKIIWYKNRLKPTK